MPLLPASIGIILNDNDTQILLIKRKDVPVWVLPGGGIESGETPESTLQREIKEETGLTVSIVRQAAEFTPLNRLASTTYIFICKIDKNLKEKVILTDETSEIAFFPLSYLPRDLFNVHSKWLAECLTSQSIIHRPLTEITYLALFKHIIQHPWQVFRFAWTRFTKNS